MPELCEFPLCFASNITVKLVKRLKGFPVCIHMVRENILHKFSPQNSSNSKAYLFTNFDQFLEIKFWVDALDCGKGLPSVSLLDTDVD